MIYDLRFNEIDFVITYGLKFKKVKYMQILHFMYICIKIDDCYMIKS